jgi:hypothetical protein
MNSMLESLTLAVWKQVCIFTFVFFGTPIFSNHLSSLLQIVLIHSYFVLLHPIILSWHSLTCVWQHETHYFLFMAHIVSPRILHPTYSSQWDSVHCLPFIFRPKFYTRNIIEKSSEHATDMIQWILDDGRRGSRLEISRNMRKYHVTGILPTFNHNNAPTLWLLVLKHTYGPV